MTDAVLQFGNTWQNIVNAFSVMAMSGRLNQEPVTSMQADTGLAAASLNGDGDAFGKLVELHQDTIAIQMRRFSRDQRVIEELVHDVFVEAYTSLKSYRAESPLLHWLRKIAVRVGYRYWKRRSRNVQQTVPLSEINGNLEQYIDGSVNGPCDASETLGGLLEVLSAPDRLVLTLIYWDGCSIEEAAELSGWSTAKVKVRAYRARNRLRTLIEESLK